MLGTPFFKTGMVSFAISVGAMLLLAVVAIVVGRKRRWL